MISLPQHCWRTPQRSRGETQSQTETTTHLLLRARGRAPWARAEISGQPCWIPGVGAEMRTQPSTVRPGQAELILSQANQSKPWPSLFELVRTQVGLAGCQCLFCRLREPSRNAPLGLDTKQPLVYSASRDGPTLSTLPVLVLCFPKPSCYPYRWLANTPHIG